MNRSRLTNSAQWVSDVNPERRTVLNENGRPGTALSRDLTPRPAVTEKAFSLTEPDKAVLHTFSSETKEKKEEIVALIKKNMDTWGAHIQKIQTEKEEQNKHFEGVSFKILMTVPVASSHEKAFTVGHLSLTHTRRNTNRIPLQGVRR